MIRSTTLKSYNVVKNNFKIGANNQLFIKSNIFIHHPKRRIIFYVVGGKPPAFPVQDLFRLYIADYTLKYDKTQVYFYSV